MNGPPLQLPLDLPNAFAPATSAAAEPGPSPDLVLNWSEHETTALLTLADERPKLLRLIFLSGNGEGGDEYDKRKEHAQTLTAMVHALHKRLGRNWIELFVRRGMYTPLPGRYYTEVWEVCKQVIWNHPVVVKLRSLMLHYMKERAGDPFVSRHLYDFVPLPQVHHIRLQGIFQHCEKLHAAHPGPSSEHPLLSFEYLLALGARLPPRDTAPRNLPVRSYAEADLRHAKKADTPVPKTIKKRKKARSSEAQGGEPKRRSTGTQPARQAPGPSNDSLRPPVPPVPPVLAGSVKAEVIDLTEDGDVPANANLRGVVYLDIDWKVKESRRLLIYALLANPACMGAIAVPNDDLPRWKAERSLFIKVMEGRGQSGNEWLLDAVKKGWLGKRGDRFVALESAAWNGGAGNPVRKMLDEWRTTDQNLSQHRMSLSELPTLEHNEKKVFESLFPRPPASRARLEGEICGRVEPVL